MPEAIDANAADAGSAPDATKYVRKMKIGSKNLFHMKRNWGKILLGLFIFCSLYI